MTLEGKLMILVKYQEVVGWGLPRLLLGARLHHWQGWFLEPVSLAYELTCETLVRIVSSQQDDFLSSGGGVVYSKPEAKPGTAWHWRGVEWAQ